MTNNYPNVENNLVELQNIEYLRLQAAQTCEVILIMWRVIK